MEIQNRRYSFQFHGQYLDFLTLLVKNMFLTIVTVGIYFAWARTERRQYLWQNAEFDGHRLEYYGQAMDLFRAYVKLALVYGAFLGITYGLQLYAPFIFVALKILTGITFFFLFPWAIYKSRTYLLQNTAWRGIRMGMNPDASPYMVAYIKGWLLTIVTLGAWNPIRMNQMQKVLIESTQLGTHNFSYDGVDQDVVKIYYKTALLSILTLGVYYFWGRAELLRYYHSHTTFGSARGNLDITGSDLLSIFLMNILLIPLTLGLAIPWVALVNLRINFGKLSFYGAIDVENLLQSQLKSSSAMSDGVAEVFDVGAGL